MKFGLWGINYKNADLDIRDKTSFTDSGKLEFLQRVGQAGIDQCMILSTCNRSEVYFLYEEQEQSDAVRRIYEALFEGVALTDYLVSLSGEEAVACLFRIAAGLESLVLGEDQILGQVKEALDFARTMGYAKKEMNKIVRDAVTCAKRIKTELKISEKPLSVSYVGIKKLDEEIGIAGREILVIGSGNAAALALKYLYESGAGKISACNRTIAHAGRLREEFPELRLVEYEDRYRVMETCDIVISATSSPHRVVRREGLRSDKPQVFLDLAAPRDVDITIGELPGKKVINLDTLQQIVEENRRERERMVERSRGMIAEEVGRTMDWLRTSRMDSTIESLQHRCGEIVDDSYEYLNRKLALNSREQKILRKVLNASLQRMLHEPIQELKQLDSSAKQEEYRQLVNQLFKLPGTDGEGKDGQ